MRRSAIFFVLGLLTLSTLTSADIYLKETFSDNDWEKRWVHSKHKEDLGKFTVTAGEFHADKIESRGLQTSEDARYYAISTKFDKIIDNTDKDLVVQFSVKHEQNIDCGGGYVKLLPPEFDALNFEGESLYNIMFGPDICGMNRKVHLIFNRKGTKENKEMKKSIKCPSDQVTHLYTLIVKPNHTYKILIDNEEAASGTLEDDFDLLPPREIIDKTAKKPDDWEDLAEIPDPDDRKPEDWVDSPATIPDPDAKKPNDWDDEMDGDWEPPHISNPAYKGEWQPKMIPNPKYKGEWKEPMIPNPDYVPEPNLHAYNTAFIGFDLWQVRSGTIFDNILITDDVETAEKFANETYVKFRDAELEAKRKLDELEKQEAGGDATDKKVDDDDIIDLDVKLGDDGEVKVTKPEKDEEVKDEKAEKEKEKVKDEKEKEVKAEKEKEKVKDEKAEKEKVKYEKVKEVKVEKEKEKVKDEKAKEVKIEEVKEKKEEVKKEDVKETKDEKDAMDKLLDDFEEEFGVLPKRKKEEGYKLPTRDEF